MVGRRGVGLLFFLGGFDGRRELFGRDDLGLLGLGVIQRVGQLTALILQRDLALGVFQHQHLGAAEGQRAFGLNELMDDLVVLQGQVFGDDTRCLEGKDPIERMTGQ